MAFVAPFRHSLTHDCVPNAPPESTLLILNARHLAELEILQLFQGPRAHDVLAGRVPADFSPLSSDYAGHVYGYYERLMGDGRTATLARIRQGDRLLELQTKGVGPNVLTRGRGTKAYAFAAIDEYVLSEMCARLAIPSTRCVAISVTQEPAERDPRDRRAVLARIAPSFIRFGTIERLYYDGSRAELRDLLDALIADVFRLHVPDESRRYDALFDEIVVRVADLVSAWQAQGFLHGYPSTDNFTVCGLSMDVEAGTGFMRRYEPSLHQQPTDPNGRFGFQNQQFVGFWNLAALANALSWFVSPQTLEAFPSRYGSLVKRRYLAIMRDKLGLANASDDDERLIEATLSMLRSSQADYQAFFSALLAYGRGEGGDGLRSVTGDRRAVSAWLETYDARLGAGGPEPAERRHERMRRVSLTCTVDEDALRAVKEAAAGGDGQPLRAMIERIWE